MITPSMLVERFEYALNNHWGYIANKAGILWTQAMQNAATSETTQKYGKRWVGHYVADCSGLFAWAFKQLGGYMYHGSNTMFRKYCTKTGKITGDNIPVGAAVFKMRAGNTSKYTDGKDYYHVGLYIGHGMVIEAKGTQAGVVKSSLASWGYYGLLKGVTYEPAKPTETIQNEVDNMTGTGKAIVDVPNDTSVNVRRKATKASSVVLQLPEGAVVNVVENDGTWAKVEFVGTGYIMSEYLVEKDA